MAEMTTPAGSNAELAERCNKSAEFLDGLAEADRELIRERGHPSSINSVTLGITAEQESAAKSLREAASRLRAADALESELRGLHKLLTTDAADERVPKGVARYAYSAADTLTRALDRYSERKEKPDA